MDEKIDLSAVTSSINDFSETMMRVLYENPSKKSEYALDEKVKEKILSDESIPFADRLTLCYGYGKIKKQFMRRKHVLELAEKYFNKGTMKFAETIEKVDEDWFEFFIEKVENTSEDRFKSMWASLLSKQLDNIENGKTDTISKKLIATICLLTPEDVEAFISICNMTFDSLEREVSKYPFIYVVENATFCTKHGLKRFKLASLNHLGLIEYSGPSTSFVLPKNMPRIKYHNYIIEFQHKEEEHIRIDCGNVRLTSDGRMLYDLVTSTCIPGFLTKCKDVWDKRGYTYTIRDTNIDV